jgi:hypothetical protein
VARTWAHELVYRVGRLPVSISMPRSLSRPLLFLVLALAPLVAALLVLGLLGGISALQVLYHVTTHPPFLAGPCGGGAGPCP